MDCIFLNSIAKVATTNSRVIVMIDDEGVSVIQKWTYRILNNIFLNFIAKVTNNLVSWRKIDEEGTD